MFDALAQSVAHAEADDFWIWSGLLAFSVAWCLYAAFRFLRHTRLIEDTPTSRIRSANQGYVELEGIGRLIEQDIACPLTNTACLWWHYKVEEERGSGKNRRWVTIDKGTSTDPFYLEDHTGRCIVNPVGAEVVPGLKRTWYGSSARPSGPPRTRGWLTSSGRYRYSEQFLFRDVAVYALGLFSTHREDSQQQVEQTVRAKLAAWKQDAARMKLFDVDQDGDINVKEWEAARRVAAAEARRELLAREPAPAVDFLSKSPLGSQPFILSAVLQKQLCSRYRWQSAGSFVWFVTGGALLVWLLLARGVL